MNPRPETIHVHDLAADDRHTEFPETAIRTSSKLPGRSNCLATPLLREGLAIGAIVIRRTEVRPFTEKQIALLETFADQAVIAIENVRLFKELDERTNELTLGRRAQSPRRSRSSGQLYARSRNRANEHRFPCGPVERHRRRGRFTNTTSHRRVSPARHRSYGGGTHHCASGQPPRLGDGVVGRAAASREPVQVPNILEERAYAGRACASQCWSDSVSVPAWPFPCFAKTHHRRLGGAAKNTGEFRPEVIELLKTFATQSAFAIQNARLFREIEDKSRQIEAANRHKSEFLANMSHELRTPLNAIIGFSEVLGERLFGELNEKQAEYTDDILSSGRHLLSLINEILDLSKVEAGRMELELATFDLPWR